MKQLRAITAFLWVMLLFSPAFAGKSSKPNHQTYSDIVPWPWGGECPFSWRKMEGFWVTNAIEPKTYFEFRVLQTTDDGGRFFEVKRYDENGDLLASGRGYSPKGEKIVSAALVVEGDSDRGYWALFRNYVESDDNSCSQAKLVTVVTMRSYEGSRCEDDSHILLNKVDARRAKRLFR